MRSTWTPTRAVSDCDALYGNTTGGANTALGFKAGFNLTTGNNNVDIANQGAAGDANTIKIGTQGTQQTAYIAGIYNVPLSGSAVVVTSTGQLGVSSVSSERFKTAIVPMGADTVKLAINNKGAIIVADQIYTQTLKFLSYRVACTGTGC